MKFRKKPIVIEASQWNPGVLVDGVTEIVHDPGDGTTVSNGYGQIDTLEGPLRVSPNDWIITGVKGEKYPCKPDIFEATYERVLRLAMICGVDCHPGDSVCNNYCNLAPQKGPMADASPPGPDAAPATQVKP